MSGEKVWGEQLGTVAEREWEGCSRRLREMTTRLEDWISRLYASLARVVPRESYCSWELR